MIDRNYQVNAIHGVKNSIRNGHKRVLVQAATGSGKTHIAARIIEMAVAKGSKILFVAHRKEIISQTSNKLASMWIKHGVIMAGTKPTDSPVQVASVQTLANRSKPEADIIFFDEAHLSISKSFMELVEYYDKSIICGLTATPMRLDGRGLGEIYSDMVQVVPMHELIEQGYLVKPRVFAPFVPNMTKVKTSKGDYDAAATAEIMNTSQITGDIIKHWQQHASGRQTIAFASSVEHSKHIAESFNKAGIVARHLDGTTPATERDETLKAWGNREFDVLTNMGLFVEGLDYPTTSCVILARPTQSLTVYLQSAGRGLRTAKNKADCIILDHAGLTYAHGMIAENRDWSLDAKKKKKKGESESAPVKICQECFAAYHAAMQSCPECSATPEKLQNDDADKFQAEGFLIEITEEHIKFLEKQRGIDVKKSEVRAAKTLQDFIKIGKDRNYKTGWAYRAFEDRSKWMMSRNSNQENGVIYE